MIKLFLQAIKQKEQKTICWKKMKQFYKYRFIYFIFSNSLGYIQEKFID